MAEQVSIIMEIIAGILLSIHFLLKKNVRATIDKWLFTRLSRTLIPRGRLRKGAWLFAGIISFCILAAIFIYGIITENNTSTTNAILSGTILVVGTILGIITVIFIVWLHGTYAKIRRFHPVGFVYLSSNVLGIILIFVALCTIKNSLIPFSFVTAYSVGMIVTGLWIMALPAFQSYFTLTNAVLVKIGLLVFVVAKFIQLSLIT